MELHMLTGTSHRLAIGVLLVAMIVGGGLRFYRLDAEEMGRAEAAAWLAASAPTLKNAVTLGRHLDPGSLGTYNVLLHGWIVAFGDRLGTMRVPSAILGTLSIVLLFAALREIMCAPGDSADLAARAELAGALAALLFACNMEMIYRGRIVRMYPLMLAAIFAQILFFARTYRRGGIASCFAAAVFAAIAVTSNYTALFFFAAEGVWLACLYIFPRESGDRTAAWRLAASLAIGGLIVAPFTFTASRVAVGALGSGTYKWIAPRSLWWPMRALQVASGNSTVWPIAALAIFGSWWQWSNRRDAVLFIWCWLAVPFAIVTAISLLLTPFMVERYVLASLAAFLVLAALGLASIESDVIRYAALTLVVVLSLAHVHRQWRMPDDVQWREAAQFAAAAAPEGTRIAVMPPGEPLMVLRYYLPPARRNDAVSADAVFDGKSRTWSFHCGGEPVAIVQAELAPEFRRLIERCYPRTLANFRLVSILGRQ
jgi:hypothetical protein